MEASNVTHFIKASDWPFASPDLKLLDYELWNVSKERACKKCHPYLE